MRTNCASPPVRGRIGVTNHRRIIAEASASTNLVNHRASETVFQHSDPKCGEPRAAAVLLIPAAPADLNLVALELPPQNYLWCQAKATRK